MKLVSSPEAFAEFLHLPRRELDDAPAPPADHMVVVFLTERVLVVRLLHVKAHFAKDATFDQEWECAVNRRFADALVTVIQRVEYLFRLEVPAQIEHGRQHFAPRRCILDAPVAKEVTEKRMYIVARFGFRQFHVTFHESPWHKVDAIACGVFPLQACIIPAGRNEATDLSA